MTTKTKTVPKPKAKEINTKISIDELKSMISEAVEDAVDRRFQDYLGDPDAGLKVREDFIQKLKAQRKAKKPRTPMSVVAKKYGLNLS